MINPAAHTLLNAGRRVIPVNPMQICTFACEWLTDRQGDKKATMPSRLSAWSQIGAAGLISLDAESLKSAPYSGITPYELLLLWALSPFWATRQQVVHAGKPKVVNGGAGNRSGAQGEVGHVSPSCCRHHAAGSRHGHRCVCSSVFVLDCVYAPIIGTAGGEKKPIKACGESVFVVGDLEPFTAAFAQDLLGRCDDFFWCVVWVMTRAIGQPLFSSERFVGGAASECGSDENKGDEVLHG